MQQHKQTRRRIMREFVIKELSAVDRPAQEGALAVIVKHHSDERGTRFENEPLSFDSFEAACTHLAKANGLSKLDAMEKAAQTHPDLVRKYNEDGERIGKAACDAAAPRPTSRALLAFQNRVDDIAKRDGCPRYLAMERARERYADEFEAAYGE